MIMVSKAISRDSTATSFPSRELVEFVAELDSDAIFSDLTAGATVSSVRSVEVGCLPGEVAMGIED